MDEQYTIRDTRPAVQGCSRLPAVLPSQLSRLGDSSRSCAMSERRKKCSKCGEVKHLSGYNKSSRSKNGRLSICRACQSRANHEYHKKHRHCRNVNRKKAAAWQGAYYRRHASEICASRQEHRSPHPERAKAVAAVEYALRRGRISKGVCEVHGAACSDIAEAHHDDYTKPLTVRWLCRSAHMLLHADQRYEQMAKEKGDAN